MKRLRMLLLLLCVTMLLIPMAEAAEQEVYFETGDFTLTVPEGMVALYPGLSNSDPAWDHFYLNDEEKENLRQGYLDDGIMAHVTTPDVDYSIYIYKAEPQVPGEDVCSYGLHLYSDGHLEKSKGKTIASSTEEQYVEEVLTYVHTQTDMVYYQVHQTADPEQVVMEYQFANGGAFIYLTGVTADPSNGEALKQAIRQVVDHITLHNVVTCPEDAPTITPEETIRWEHGISVYVPRNWTVLDSDEQVMTLESDLLVSYVLPIAVGDLWEGIPEEVKAGYSRADLNMDNPDEVFLTEFLGIAEEPYTRVTYGENEFFMMPRVQTVKAYNNAEIDCVEVITIRNGIMVDVIFSDTAESPLYSDFLRMLERLELPAVEEPAVVSPIQPVKPAQSAQTNQPVQPEEPEKTEQKKDGLLRDILTGGLIGAVTAIVIGLVKLLLPKKNKQTRNQTQTQQPPVPPRPKFCAKCGTPVDEHARFCKNCGTKIE